MSEGAFRLYRGPVTRLCNFHPMCFYLLPSAWITWPFNPSSFVFVMCWLKWGFCIEHFPVII